MTTAQFQGRYTDPTNAAALPMPDRARVAGALFSLQQELKGGRVIAGAMATVTSQDRHMDALAAASNLPSQESCRSDFLGITAL